MSHGKSPLEYEYETNTNSYPNTKEKTSAPSGIAPKRNTPTRCKKQKFGKYGWIHLSAEEYSSLVKDFGEKEITHCIEYVDEYVQSNGNRNGYKDWDIVLRKAARENWGEAKLNKAKSASSSKKKEHSYNLEEMLEFSMNNIPEFDDKNG